MINKFYDKIKKFIKDSYIYISLYLVLFATLSFPLPYYIYNGGGTISVDDRVMIEDSYTKKGSFNLCYVSEIRANVFNYLLARMISNWEIEPEETVTLNNKETMEDAYKRDRIMLEDANINAIHVAYLKANKTFEITDTYNYIIYLSEDADTDLKIGDILKEADGESIESLTNLKEIINNRKVNDIIYFVVERNNKEVNCYGKIIEINGVKQIGISLQTAYDYKTTPNIKLNFSSNESGPSGGLLLTLSIYNHLIEEDITNGLKIAGTGTIDWDGNVGSIGGVKYKLSGAVKSNADVFIVPNGENYEEAIKIKNEKNYDIEIIGVSTFDETLEKLSLLK